MVTETDTFLTLPLLGELTYREWHHLVGGIYTGYRDADRSPPETQTAYWQAGWLLGHAITVTVRHE